MSITSLREEGESIFLQPSDLNTMGGASLSGLRGRVQVRAVGLRNLHIRDSPELVALDLWGCPSEMVLDLDHLPALEEVFVPEGGAVMELHLALVERWQPLHVHGRLKRSCIDVTGCESIGEAKGLYRFGESRGLALLPATRLKVVANVQRYVRVDQHQRGLQYKDLRRGAGKDEVLWQLQRPSRPGDDPAAWLCESSWDSGRFHDLVAEMAFGGRNSEACTFSTGLDRPGREDRLLAGLDVLGRLAHRGIESTTLWQARCLLQPVELSARLDAGEVPSAATWPWLLKSDSPDRQEAIARSDLELWTLCALSESNFQEEVPLPQIDQARHAMGLAGVIAALRVGDGEKSSRCRDALVRCLTEALVRLRRRYDELASGSRKARPLSRQERLDLFTGRVLYKLFDEAAPVEDRDCTNALISLVREHLHGGRLLPLGIQLATSGNPAGRTMIVRALGSDASVSPGERAQAMEALLQPSVPSERQDLSSQ